MAQHRHCKSSITGMTGDIKEAVAAQLVPKLKGVQVDATAHNGTDDCALIEAGIYVAQPRTTCACLTWVVALAGQQRHADGRR